MKRSQRVALALDIGGTNFRAALVSSRGHVLHRYSQPMPLGQGPELALKEITGRLLAMMTRAKPGELVGLGVAVAGPLERETGVLYRPPNLPGWDRLPIIDYWRDQLGLPVSAGNDANLAALGEKRFGVARGVRDFIFITIGTGIGGGIISGGNLLTGSRGFAGEIGHMSVNPQGPLCNCGNIGCLEAMASGTAIARMAREELHGGGKSLILTMAGVDVDQVTTAEVTAAAFKGDRVALRVLRKAATSLAQGIVSLVHVFNPSLVAVGGGVSQGWALWAGVVERYVYKRAMEAHQQGLRIVPGGLGDDAGLMGAAALVFLERARSVSRKKA